MKSILLLPVVVLLLVVNTAYLVEAEKASAYFNLVFAAVGIVLANYAYILYHRNVGGIGLLTYFSAIYLAYGIAAYFKVDLAVLNLAAAFVVLFLVSFYWHTGSFKHIFSPLQPIAVFTAMFIALAIGCRDPLWYSTLPLYEVILYSVDRTGGNTTWSRILWLLYPLVIYTFPYTYSSGLFALASAVIFYAKTSSKLGKYLDKVVSTDILVRPLLSVI